ncbi:hypothetical protein C3L33_17520, partial [Rhododendron williamsianum]
VGLEDGFGVWDSVGKEEGDVRIEAAKILANLIIMGSGIMARAVVQAYRQALANAAKSGVAQETVQNAVRRGSKTMTEQEAGRFLASLRSPRGKRLLRSTIIYLKIMLRMGASTSNRKFTGLKSVWNLYINPKIKVLLVEKKPGEVCIAKNICRSCNFKQSRVGSMLKLIELAADTLMA